jgi:hypothetical protein
MVTAYLNGRPAGPDASADGNQGARVRFDRSPANRRNGAGIGVRRGLATSSIVMERSRRFTRPWSARSGFEHEGGDALDLGGLLPGHNNSPRKNGPGITHSDILVINKTDLAPHVGASLEVMQPSLRVAAYAALGTVFTFIAQAALNVALTPLAIPALTAPFVLASWIFLLPRQCFEPVATAAADAVKPGAT